MSAYVYILLAVALAIVAFIGGLFFSGPDQKALDELHKSAMPYDSMHVSLDNGESRDTELANTTPLRPGSVVWARPAITVHRIPMRRRARRFLRALWDFLTAPCFKS